jgi:hypothetical protein
MNDEIIREVWKAKDDISADSKYDVKRLVHSLLSKESKSGARVIDVHEERLSILKEDQPPYG